MFLYGQHQHGLDFEYAIECVFDSINVLYDKSDNKKHIRLVIRDLNLILQIQIALVIYVNRVVFLILLLRSKKDSFLIEGVLQLNALDLLDERVDIIQPNFDSSDATACYRRI